MKIICADRVSVRLSYDANCKWHMPIYAKICRAEQKYMPFLGKNPKHRNIQMMQHCTPDYFSGKRARWWFWNYDSSLFYVLKLLYFRLHVSNCLLNNLRSLLIFPGWLGTISLPSSHLTLKIIPFFVFRARLETILTNSGKGVRWHTSAASRFYKFIDESYIEVNQIWKLPRRVFKATNIVKNFGQKLVEVISWPL